MLTFGFYTKSISSGQWEQSWDSYQRFFSGIQTWVFLFSFFIRQTVLLAGWGGNGGSCLREICTEKKRSHQRCFLSNQCLLYKDIKKGLINMVDSRQGILPHIIIYIWFWIPWIRKKLRSVYFSIPLWLNFTVNRFEIDCMPLHWSLFIYEFAISQKHFNSIS